MHGIGQINVVSALLCNTNASNALKNIDKHTKAHTEDHECNAQTKQDEMRKRGKEPARK